MTTGLYDAGRDGFLTGLIDWDGLTIEAHLIIDTHVENLATHDFLDDVPAIDRAASQDLAGNVSDPTGTGVADATDEVFLAVAAGDTLEAVILNANRGGPETADNLIAFIDNATQFLLATNGGDITVVWDNGVNKIFKL